MVCSLVVPCIVYNNVDVLFTCCYRFSLLAYIYILVSVICFAKFKGTEYSVIDRFPTPSSNIAIIVIIKRSFFGHVLMALWINMKLLVYQNVIETSAKSDRLAKVGEVLSD